MIIMACICVFIPVSWTGHVIIRDFYNLHLVDAQRRELGEALYIGWVAAAFLFAGGCFLTCCNLQSEDKGSERYIYSRNSDYTAYSPYLVYPQQLVLQPQPQPTLSRHPSTNHSYQSRQPSVHSAVTYL
ncbi:hypothetical protein LDENG_00161380 [Lucifuga dentata]|nr:hypothetical protein LDENG_00161380 [Lucifuga dentata]